MDFTSSAYLEIFFFFFYNYYTDYNNQLYYKVRQPWYCMVSTSLMKIKCILGLHWSLGAKKNSENWCNIGPSINR